MSGTRDKNPSKQLIVNVIEKIDKNDITMEFEFMTLCSQLMRLSNDILFLNPRMTYVHNEETQDTVFIPFLHKEEVVDVFYALTSAVQLKMGGEAAALDTYECTNPVFGKGMQSTLTVGDFQMSLAFTDSDQEVGYIALTSVNKEKGQLKKSLTNFLNKSNAENCQLINEALVILRGFRQMTQLKEALNTALNLNPKFEWHACEWAGEKMLISAPLSTRYEDILQMENNLMLVGKKFDMYLSSISTTETRPSYVVKIASALLALLPSAQMSDAKAASKDTVVTKGDLADAKNEPLKPSSKVARALNVYAQGIAIYKETKDRNYTPAISLFNEALAVLDAEKEMVSLAQTYSSLASCHREMGNLAQAQVCLDKASAIYKAQKYSIGSPEIVAINKKSLSIYTKRIECSALAFRALLKIQENTRIRRAKKEPKIATHAVSSVFRN